MRLGATAAALLLVAAAGYSVRPIRKGAWAKSTPTDGLLLVQSTFGQWTTRHVRSELDTRIDTMSIRQRRWLAGVAVHALGDDYEPWNAVWAMGALSELGPDAEPAILGGLSSGDWQQRQLCAEVSRRKFEAARSGVGPLEYRSPSPRLIEVSVEALADDGLPYGAARRVTGRSTATTWVMNARSSLAFLAACGEDAEPFLRPALRSPDPQQLFLAACSAGLARCDGLASEAIPLLIPHLKSDERTGNAKLAAAALFAFGEHARPSVEHLTSGGADEQQRRIARRILAEWEGPARDVAEAAARDAIYAEWSDEPFTAVRRGGVPGFHPFLE